MRGGPEHVGWDLHAHLLAGVLDALNGANYQRSGGKGQKPKPIPRPGKKSKGKGLGSIAPPRIPKRGGTGG